MILEPALERVLVVGRPQDRVLVGLDVGVGEQHRAVVDPGGVDPARAPQEARLVPRRQAVRVGEAGAVIEPLDGAVVGDVAVRVIARVLPVVGVGHAAPVGRDLGVERALEGHARVDGRRDRRGDLGDHATVALEVAELVPAQGDHPPRVGLRDGRVAAVAGHLVLAGAVRGREEDVAALDVGDRVRLRGGGGDRERGERRGRDAGGPSPEGVGCVVHGRHTAAARRPRRQAPTPILARAERVGVRRTAPRDSFATGARSNRS